MSKSRVRNVATSYEVDFYRWTQETAELLRDRRMEEIDLEHVAEEIADMGRRDQREARSRLIVLMMHLLKWQLQPKLRDKSSWVSTLVEQRRKIQLLLDDSASLYRVPESELPLIYMQAARDAIQETGLPEKSFPSFCPYTWEEVLSRDFFPDGPFRENINLK